MKNETLNIYEREIVDFNIKHLPMAINLFSKEKESNKLHWHYEIEFVLILSGNAFLHIEKKCFPLNKDSIVIIHPHVKHKIVFSDNEDCRFLSIHTDNSLFMENKALREYFIKPLMNSNYAFLIVDSSYNNHGIIKEMMTKIYNLTQKRPKGYSLYLVGLIECIMAEIISIYRPKADKRVKKDSELEILENMYSYILRCYQNKIYLDDIAKAGNVCKNKCTQIFNKYYFSPPIEFLNNIRLSASRDLLISSTMSTADIALSCGFSNQSYFISLFKKRFDMTPCEYRKANIEKTPY
ncbi:AraC-type DNA-binding protein [Acetitomaculum ruminis DSM 5522]|uniref:AraC-type DNA-binding protein n=1 Tax=Acetitomaculum ruminis DSM 5522 TaxID=1120918 RepID=A0A1I0WMT2_9FIRM|nr:helix-turn-helix domain-containing protein [Acetitomaculum ruminis]SFA90075.1 AraC-type DNA-binding protein [Acetitomaculum ruminis DSM 5522]